MEPNDSINAFLQSIGITEVGFCTAEPLLGYADFVMQRQQQGTYLDRGHQKTMEEDDFYQPHKSLSTAQSVIVIFMPYHLPSMKEIQPKLKISGAALMDDYHVEVMNKLTLLKDFIQVSFGAASTCHCDLGPLNDKSIALKTGKLNLGRNSLLLHPHFGSRFYIGYVITELICDSSKSMELDIDTYESLFHPFCAKCGKCMKSCPNNAIEQFGQLSSRKCISYLTQSNKWTVEDARLKPEAHNLSGYIYGCDICQQVCPLNGIVLESEDLFNKSKLPLMTLESFQEMSNKAFHAQFKHTTFGWIGKKRLERNIVWNIERLYKGDSHGIF